jgi:hypothetical protein
MWKKEIAREFESFVNKEFCIEKDLTDKQQGLLGPAKRTTSKRKAAKEPSEHRPKRIAKEASGKKKTKKPRKMLLTNDDEMDEEAEVAAALKAVAEKLEEEEKEMNKSWECHIEPASDPHMDSAVFLETAKTLLTNQKIYQVLDNGKFPDYVVNDFECANVYVQSTFSQPPLVKPKHILKICLLTSNLLKIQNLREGVFLNVNH